MKKVLAIAGISAGVAIIAIGVKSILHKKESVEISWGDDIEKLKESIQVLTNKELTATQDVVKEEKCEIMQEIDNVLDELNKAYEECNEDEILLITERLNNLQQKLIEVRNIK